MLKHNKIGVIALLLFGMVIIWTGIVCADPGVIATPEIQSLSTVTTAEVVGLAMETDTGVWTLTNDPWVMYTTTVLVGEGYAIPGPSFPGILAQVQNAGGSLVYTGPYAQGQFMVTQFNIPQSLLNQQVAGVPGDTFPYQNLLNDLVTFSNFSDPAITGGGIHTGALDPGQVQYTTAYDANIVAQGGKTSFVKQMNLHTGNKVISQSNLNAQTGLTFAATSGGGNVIGSENLMLDGAGMNTTASDKLLCPFAAGIANAIPAYCNIVQAGSMFDLTIGSVTTRADNAFVHNDATIPVVLNYNINVKPYSTAQGEFAASGSTSAYIKAHIQEGRRNGTVKAEDLIYNEQSGAQGTIRTFNKVMSYSSQITSPAAGNHIIHASVGTTGTFTTTNGLYHAFIRPIGDVQVPDHTSITFTMGTQRVSSNQFSTTAGPAHVFVDGVDKGEISSFTFQDVTSDHTIVALPEK
jgi:hypothetical protein